MVECNAKNRAANRERVANWKESYREERRHQSAAYRVANPEKVAAAQARWRAANRATVAALSAKRHAAKLQRTPQWSIDNLGIQFEFECIYKYCAALNAIGLSYHLTTSYHSKVGMYLGYICLESTGNTCDN